MGGGFYFFRVMLDSADGIDADQAMFGIRVERTATPGPVFGMINQFSFQRIHVHIVKLFNPFLQAPDIEVVKSSLPKPTLRIFGAFKAQIQLSSIRSLLPAQPPGDTLFQNLDHRGRRSYFRLAHEQMDVFRHDDISDKREPIAVPHLAKNLNRSILGADRAQERHAPVTTKGDEMEMPRP